MQLKLFLFVTFLVIVQICSCIEPKITFTETQMFHDISTYNFALGRNTIYEFAIQARLGQKVHLYLFKNDFQQYKLSVHDGPDANAPVLSIQANIPDNRNIIEFPTPISSSGDNMYVVITADHTNPAAKVDFQAMVTDYVQQGGCGKMVINENVADKPIGSYKLEFIPQDNCYYILHANDPTNNPLMNQYIQAGANLDSRSLTVFKGLQTYASRVLVVNELIPETYATDKYLVLLPTDTVYINFAWTFDTSLDRKESVRRYSHESFMTNDYYQDAYPNLAKELTQIFTLQKQSPVTDIQLSYINFVGAGTLIVSSYLKESPTVSQIPLVYHASDFTGPFNMTYSGVDHIVLEYSTPDRNLVTGSGFYFLFDDASVYRVVPSTTRQTTRLPETATKSAENLFSSAIMLVFACIVHIM